ncbi:hypothetical protein LZ198_22890 [Myxococcus sp. K15C18031901]|uniref:hypothetical protein n=1 Tax=Myxococcus dinghuensis TaxID=2906761 RepID=UPI0020A738CC|nr:hypothetical protein [Myxococcus dinghuensis]MCP3101729.1 hypothetical protein [Myxococcus dinghuensis]
MVDRLKDVFRRQSPELVLTGAVGDGVLFEMLDVDGYRIGGMRCRGVVMVCMATRHVSYDRVERYGREELPAAWSWLREGIPPGFAVYVFGMADLPRASESCLPAVGGRRLAYVVCESVEFEGGPGGR